MLDELRQIAIFAKTVDHGSFRAAARALQLSPSVVSHHVAQLEQRLGTALLYRSTRSLSLTPDGERLLESAHAMVEAAESGAEFAIEYPKVELSLDLSELRRDIIADGFDVAIRAGQMQDSSFKAQKLFQFNRRLVASPAYVKSQPVPATPNDLKDWDWLELSPVRHVKAEFKSGRKRITVQRKKSRISINSAQALSRMARAGTGLAIIPEYFTAPLVEAGELEYVLSDWAVEPINVFAVWPSNAPKNGLVKHLVKFLKEKQENASTSQTDKPFR